MRASRAPVKAGSLSPKELLKRKQPLGMQAYHAIRRKIIILELHPGQLLDERQLIAELGLGRTPVREALLRLAGEGWIETQPNKCAIVPPITLQGTKAIFEAMKILEVGVAGLLTTQNVDPCLTRMIAANRDVKNARNNGDIFALVEANHNFHMSFAHCAQNDFLSRALRDVGNKAKRIAFLSYGTDIDPQRSLPVHYESVVHEHEEIIDCVHRRDEEGLKRILLNHITTFQQRIVCYITS
jgi:GntR family transcriptional regulator, rspAB operon transcriptional repressor